MSAVRWRDSTSEVAVSSSQSSWVRPSTFTTCAASSLESASNPGTRTVAGRVSRATATSGMRSMAATRAAMEGWLSQRDCSAGGASSRIWASSVVRARTSSPNPPKKPSAVGAYPDSHASFR